MRTRTKAWRSAIAAGLTATMIISTAGGAHADEPTETADDTVAVVEKTAGDLVMPVADSTVVTDDGTVSVEGGVEVAVPADAGAPITVTDVTGDAPTVEIGLPDLGGSGESDVTEAGVSVFDGDDASIVVQSVEGGGVQAIVTLDNADAPTLLPFAVDAEPGSQMTVNADGGVDVIAVDGTPIGGFAPPWAVDATGSNVPTHFEISADGQVVQIVDTNADTAFPVVADPWWNPFSWNWSKAKNAVKKVVKWAKSHPWCAVSITAATAAIVAGGYAVASYGGPTFLVQAVAGGAVNLGELAKALGLTTGVVALLRNAYNDCR